MANSAGAPQWLECLTNLLSTSETAFIADVVVKIMNGAYGTRENSRTRKLNQLAGSMTINFRLLAGRLQESVQSRRRFLRKYPEWRDHRDRNVIQLRIIADSVDAKKKEAQETQIASSFLSILGGGMLLARGGFIPRLLVTAFVGLSTVASIGVSLEEGKTLEENIKKAEEIIKLDKKDLKDLLEWINAADCLKKAKDKFEDSMKCYEDFLPIAMDLWRVLIRKPDPKQKEREVQKILKGLNVPLHLAEEIASVVGILISFLALLKNFENVFKLISEDHSNLSNLSADLIRTAYVGMNTFAVVNKCGQLTRVLKSKICKGILLDTVSIVLISLQDPNSAEGKELRKIADGLEREAEDFEKLYKSMK